MSSQLCQKLLEMARKDISLSFSRIIGFIETITTIVPEKMVCNKTEWKLEKCLSDFDHDNNNNKKCCGSCWYMLNDNKFNTTNTNGTDLPDWLISCNRLCNSFTE